MINRNDKQEQEQTVLNNDQISKIETELNSYAEVRYIPKNDNNQSVLCRSKIVDSYFDQSSAMKGMTKTYAYISCLGYLFDGSTYVEGTIMPEQLIYFEVPGTNSGNIAFFNVIRFDDIDRLKDTRPDDPIVTKGLEIIGKGNTYNLLEEIRNVLKTIK